MNLQPDPRPNRNADPNTSKVEPAVPQGGQPVVNIGRAAEPKPLMTGLNFTPDARQNADPNSGRAEAAAPRGREVATGQAAAVRQHLDDLGRPAVSTTGGMPAPAVGNGNGALTPHLQALNADRLAKQGNGAGTLKGGKSPDATQRSRK